MTTMKQLDDATRRALLAGQDPPRGAQERVLRAILAAGPPGDGGGGGGELGGGELGGELGGQVAGASGRALELGFAAKVVGATIGLTAAGLVTLALASAGVRSLRTDAPVSARTPALEHATAPAPLAAPVRAPAAVPEAPSVLTTTGESSEPSAKSITIPVPVEPKSITTTSLEAELALMQDARAAQAPAARLALLERHAREFAGGVLADEREVLRVETECALGRVGDAEARAAAFVAANPSHPLRSRVEPACEK